MPLVARNTSRRKHSKPEINVSIAEMNSNATAGEGSRLISDPMKSAAMTMQMSSADNVQKLTAQ